MAEVDRYISGLPDEQARREFVQRYEMVLKIVRNPAQLAFDTLMHAEDVAAMQNAIERHEMLREPEFLAQLRGLEQSMDRKTADRLTQQLTLHSRARDAQS
jgi:hypothetical protein